MDDELKTLVANKAVNKVLDKIILMVKKDVDILSMIPCTDPSHFDHYLSESYKGLLAELFTNLSFPDLVSFSNTFALMCQAKDKIKVLLNTGSNIPHNPANILSFFASAYGRLHEEKGNNLLDAMLHNEIEVFLQMQETYLKAYTSAPLEDPNDKYEQTLFNIDNNKSTVKAEIGASKVKADILASTATVSESKPGLRGSYVKIYPTNKNFEEKKISNARTILSKTSFKTVSINFSFHNPSFLQREKRKISSNHL